MKKIMSLLMVTLMLVSFIPTETYAIEKAITKESEEYTYVLAKYSIDYDVSRTGSGTNAKIACEEINGVIVQPGKEFSFNKTMKKADEAEKWVEGLVISNGKLVPGIGGGICITSSVLFNALLHGNFDITERHQHGLKVNYVLYGRDSAISDYQDLKFVNNYDVPVKIVTSVENKKVTISIKTKEYVEVPNVIVKTILYKNKYYTYRYIKGSDTISYYCTSKYKD